MEQDLKKSNFFKNIWTSIKDFEGYERFAAERVIKAISYIVLLTLIFTIGVTATYTYQFYSGIESVKKYIDENIEEITLKSGKLEVVSDKKIIIEDEKSFIPIIIVDTSEDAEEGTYLEKAKAYDTGIILLSDKMIVRSNFTNIKESIQYSNLFDFDIPSKESALNLLGRTKYDIYANDFLCNNVYISICSIFKL